MNMTNTDARKRAAEAARQPDGLEALLAEHFDPGECVEAGHFSPQVPLVEAYCAHLAAVIREWLLSDERVEWAAEATWSKWLYQASPTLNRAMYADMRRALTAAVDGAQ